MFIHTNQPQYEELDVVTRSDGVRTYTTPDGKRYPSVTTMLDHAPKTWLEEWRKRLGYEKAAIETQRCADRGEAVHLMAERYLKNDPDPTRDQEDLPGHLSCFNQLKFLLNKIGNIRAQEIPLFSHTLELAGRVDCVAEYEGELTIIDFKTSNNNKNHEMVYDYFLQSTAYAIMWREMFQVPINTIVVLIAVQNGIMPLKFKRSIDEFIDPLVDRINTYYSEVKVLNELSQGTA
ncbi:hypothetical protein LCGC14_2043460 [marine sediment metagenome]|uniref:PD-(D/E)XK endonuclease-like domain-containing protein n=1 Tax=marine sediment metagenome TaxID=412755 RepID=A0A0F9FDQ3_9ZZZZ